MQVNQQICQEMEQLDKKLEENDCQKNSEVHAYDCFCFLSCFFFSNTTLCIHCCMHFTQKKSRGKLKWIKQSVFHNCITRHNCERGMEESKRGLSVWQSSLSVWLSPSVVFLSAVKFVYLAFYPFCVSALICLSIFFQSCAFLTGGHSKQICWKKWRKGTFYEWGYWRKPFNCYLVLNDKMNCTHILIGSFLWFVEGQTYKWGHPH